MSDPTPPLYDCQGNAANFVSCDGFQDDGTFFLPGTPAPSYLAAAALVAPTLGLIGATLLVRKPTAVRVGATFLTALVGVALPVTIAAVLRKEDEVGV